MASPPARCPGTLGRRSFVRAGLAGITSLALFDLFRLQAAGGSPVASPKSVIAIWLWGGPSHLETFDLKPDAPAEYRGEFRPIPTSVPGLQICEHLPRLARVADKFALVRSVTHDSPGHVNSTHTLVTIVVAPAARRRRHSVTRGLDADLGSWVRRRSQLDGRPSASIDMQYLFHA